MILILFIENLIELNIIGLGNQLQEVQVIQQIIFLFAILPRFMTARQEIISQQIIIIG